MLDLHPSIDSSQIISLKKVQMRIYGHNFRSAQTAIINHFVNQNDADLHNLYIFTADQSPEIAVLCREGMHAYGFSALYSHTNFSPFRSVHIMNIRVMVCYVQYMAYNLPCTGYIAEQGKYYQIWTHVAIEPILNKTCFQCCKIILF